MLQKISFLIFATLLSTAAFAQENGLAIGIHQTTAAYDGTTSGSVSGKLGFEAGWNLAFELIPNLRFRTGVMFDQRHFDYKVTNVGKVQFNFDYIDVPVNVQYSFAQSKNSPTFGVFGGLIVGVKAGSTTKLPELMSNLDVDMKSLYPLVDVGFNMTFDDMIGFDLYVDHGVGTFADVGTSDSVKDYTDFGLRFIYWL